MSRLRLVGGTVVRSLDPVVLEPVDLLVDGERIAAETTEEPGETPTGAAAVPSAAEGAITTIDCTGCLVIPGNVCAHTHAYSALARGMPYRLEPPTSFVEILRRVWWRLDRALDPASIRASALVAGMEALLSGTTTLVDHHASPNAVDGSLDLIADAFATLGVRSVLCYETSDRDGPAIARAGLHENARLAARVAAGAYPAARAMIGAHASFTLSEATLEACVDAARSASVGLHVHAAEDEADERDSLDRWGVRVAQRLARAGALDRRSLLAHGVRLDDGELEIVEAAGATIVHNARSNMNNRVGQAPLGGMRRVALGTDGIGADMFEESRVAYLNARARNGIDDPAWPLERLATSARVAAASFAEPDLGLLVPGAPADLVVLKPTAPTPIRADTLAGHWTFGGLSIRAVRDVVVAGRAVVRDRRLVDIDQEALLAGARSEATALWGRLEHIDEHPFDPRLAGVR